MGKVLKLMLVLALIPALIIFSGSCNNNSTGNQQTTTLTTTVATATQVIKDISVTEANALIQANASSPDFIVIDVRTADEYATGHLPNTINIDYYLKNFSQEISKLDRTRKYLLYCRTGARSAGARDVMKSLGFTDINNMTGGITAWMAQGYPVVK